MKKYTGRLEVIQSKRNKQWSWRKRASNGKIICGSWETFHNKLHAIRQAKREYPDLADTLLVISSRGVSMGVEK